MAAPLSLGFADVGTSGGEIGSFPSKMSKLSGSGERLKGKTLRKGERINKMKEPALAVLKKVSDLLINMSQEINDEKQLTTLRS